MTSPSPSPTTSPAPRLDVAALTDKGIKRAANEDAYGLFDLPGMNAAIVVADGMGGLQAGDIASEETITVMEETLRERLGANDSPGDALTEAFVRANARVFAIAETVRKGAENAAKQADADTPTAKRGDYSKTAPLPKSGTPLMGATCVAALLQNETLTIAHAGDSRLYRLRAGSLESLTFDHSFVAESVRRGDISEAEARVSRFRNMITRAVGIDDSIKPEIRTETVQFGDTYLLCTDGLNTMIDDAEIAELLAQPVASSAVAASLVEAANRRGGSDNITVVVMRVLDGSGAMPVAAVPVTQTSAAERPAATPQTPRPVPANRPPIVDMETRSGNGRRSVGVSPFVAFLAFVGVICLGIGAIVAAAPEARTNMGRWLAPLPKPSPPPAGKVPAALSGNTLRIKDYAHMEYKSPVAFGAQQFAVRGDILGYSPKAGIFFVKDTSGLLTYMDRSGAVKQATFGDALPIPPPIAGAVPPSRLFTAVDLQGNLYISYSARKMIVKYNRDGTVLRKITGSERPEALTVDEDGNLYVIYDSQIKKLEAKPAAPKKPAAPPTP